MNRERLDAAILVDEVGIESGIYGGLRLKTVYRPVFALTAGFFRIVAVDAATQAWRADRPAGLADLPIDEADDAFLELLCQTLVVNNYKNLFLPGCELILDHQLANNDALFEAVDRANEVAESMGQETLEFTQLVCRIARPTAGEETAAQLRRLRDAGVRTVVDLFEAVPGHEPAAAEWKPDIGEFSDEWVAKIAGNVDASRLLRLLIEAHEREGIDTYARRISNVQQLNVVVDAGITYVSGDLLAPAALAGTAVNAAPRPLAGFRGSFRRIEEA